jgi:hypothetical protein
VINYDRFKEADSEYRSAPFWSWNDRLEKETLVDQIREMHKQGMGGFFMHPRGGMFTEYFSPEYMEAVKACIEEAERLGMKAWLYDEDRFPSGSAGGKVVGENPEFAATALCLEKVHSREFTKNEPILKIFSYNEDQTINDISSLQDEEINQLNTTLLVFSIRKAHASARFNNQPYTDLCNPDAVDSFINHTHEVYKKAFQSYFSNTVPGIFTDEPHFNVKASGGHSLPWTKGLDEIFLKEKGYCLLDHLPQLFLDIGYFKKIRYDYFDVMTKRFLKAFSENIYRWCEENGLQFTGHYWEHVFPRPDYTGSTMPNYEFMQAPGIDMLFVDAKDRPDQFGNDLIVKEVSSVANQLGKKRVLSETYGASGWELNFISQKRTADWQFAQGINLVCQHLVLYSMTGYRKRDFPLSFMNHQPWWECYHLLGDYIGRLSYILSQGEYIADILVLHPSGSTWTEYSPMHDNKTLEEIEHSIKTLVRNLNGIQFGFDLGDEILMERHGRVENGKLILGKMAYKTIILPQMTVLRNSTLELLKAFIAQGGTIIAAGQTPTLLDGAESDEVKGFFEGSSIIRIDNATSSLKEQLRKLQNNCVTIENLDGGNLFDIYSHQRKEGDEEILFLCNISEEDSYHTRLELDAAFHVEEWDAVTGDKRIVVPYYDNGRYFIDLNFPPVGSRLLVIDKSGKSTYSDMYGKSTSSSQEETQFAPKRTIELNQYEVKRAQYNALTVNQCIASLNNGPWEGPMDVLRLDDSFKQRLGMEKGDVGARQPWMYSEEEKNHKASVRAKYFFTLSGHLSGDLYLAAESPELYTVTINGHIVHPADKYYRDKAFVMYDIKEYCSTGQNEVMLHTDQYGVLMNLESIYIVGDFQLKNEENDFVIIEEDGSLATGDWTCMGYPYYSGKMEYTADVSLRLSTNERATLVLEGFSGIACKVCVNGREAAVLGWKPYEADITPYLQEGSNEIKIVVMNSLQNLLGPHSPLKPDKVVTPGSFYSQEHTRFIKSGFDGKAKILVK